MPRGGERLRSAAEKAYRWYVARSSGEPLLSMLFLYMLLKELFEKKITDFRASTGRYKMNLEHLNCATK